MRHGSPFKQTQKKNPTSGNTHSLRLTRSLMSPLPGMQSQHWWNHTTRNAYYGQVRWYVETQIKQIQHEKLKKRGVFHSISGCHPGMQIWIGQHTTPFTWFGTLRLLPFPKHKEEPSVYSSDSEVNIITLVYHFCGDPRSWLFALWLLDSCWMLKMARK